MHLRITRVTVTALCNIYMYRLCIISQWRIDNFYFVETPLDNSHNDFIWTQLIDSHKNESFYKVTGVSEWRISISLISLMIHIYGT